MEKEASPFSLADIISCCKRNKRISDETILKLEQRMARDIAEFKREKLLRSNRYLKKVIIDFFEKREIRRIPQKFVQYLEQLDNPHFEQEGDLVEILVAETARIGEKKARKFVRRILKIILESNTHLRK